MKNFLLFIFAFVIGITANAQKVSGSVKGVLQDSSSSTGLPDATVSVVRVSDSTLISFSLTRSNGNFEIKNLEAGTYNLIASYTGLKTLKKNFTISGDKPIADLGIINLDKYYNTLEGVVVTDEAPIRIKGDTLAYKADAFKTKPNATVEDLLKKLPGVQVERDGTVKTQGETVQKVYVDGKEFFGNDPKLATKNLNADMVDQVEVYDDMSEQAKFNNIDDGSRSKAINLKLKKDKKKGVFGKAYAGTGTEGRYDVGLNANMFKGATQTSIIAKSNNTNNIGFTFSDMIGMFGTGGGFGGGGMNVVRAPGAASASLGGLNLGSSGSGITKSTQVGINYRDTWSKYFDVNGSYFFNQVNTLNDKNTFRTTVAQDSSMLSDNLVRSNAANSNHRVNLNMIYTIDSFNSIIYSPNFNYQVSNSISEDSIHTDTQKGDSRYLNNRTLSDNSSEGSGYNWVNNLIWRKKFRRAGRTLAVTLNNTISNSNRDSYSDFVGEFYNPSGVKWRTVNRNTLTDADNETRNFGVAFSYTEPIARDKILEVNYQHNNNRNVSEKRTYEYDPLTDKFDNEIDSLNNNYSSKNFLNSVGTNLRIVKKKYNYQVGISVKHTTMESLNLDSKNLVKQNFINFFPTAIFNYNFARSRSFRFNYRGSTRQPSISQLQDVQDISNLPYITQGNPLLSQEFTHNFSLSYNFFDIIRFRNFFAFLNFSKTYDKIASSVKQLPGGVQLTTPVNLNGVFNMSGVINFGLPIKKMKGGNFNTNTRINISRDVNLFDDVTNYTNRTTLGEDLRLSYNYKEKLDMGIGVTAEYNSVTYTVQHQPNDRYFQSSYSADITYTLPKGFILATDFEYTLNNGRSDGYNQNFALLNASLAKTLFKSQKGEIKFSVYDLLNQNISVTRNVGTNYVEDVQTSVLQRFLMLTFTYRLNRMGGRQMPAIMERATKNLRIQ
jgi:hypothetical protein